MMDMAILEQNKKPCLAAVFIYILPVVQKELE